MDNVNKNKAALFLFLLALSSCSSKKIEIPFIIENKRIVVEATIDQQAKRFVFDTGATESYLDISVENLKPEGITITKVNGEQSTVQYYQLNQITFGDNTIKTKSWVINSSDLLRQSQNDGFDGILGAMTFEGYWCELSFSKMMIILHKQKPRDYKNHCPAKILFGKYNADFFIPVLIDGITYYFDIDTGAPYGICFPERLFQERQSNEYYEVISDDNKINKYYLIKTNSVEILNDIYLQKYVMTNSLYSIRDDEVYKGLGVLGIDFLKYYDFLLDYRKLNKGKTTGLYYRPNTPLRNRNYGIYGFINEVPSFGVLNNNLNPEGFRVHRIIKDSIAYKDFYLRPGMIVTKINGKQINAFEQSEISAPLFYMNIKNYTFETNGIEQTIIPRVSLGQY